MASPFISVIVPTFRRPDALALTLNALAAQEYDRDRYEIIVVDDAADAATAATVEEGRSRISHIRYLSQVRRGVATARNAGATAARGEILVFNDDDIIPCAAMLQLQAETLTAYGRCMVNGHWEFEPGLAGELNKTSFGRFRIKTEDWVKVSTQKTPIAGSCYEASMLTACNLGVRARSFRELGGFDEQFPYAGCEDQDFALRAAAGGFRFIYNREIALLHNDNRQTLRQFCERQRRGATTAVLLGVKHPGARGQDPIIVENGPIGSTDPVRLKVKKLGKWVAALPAPLAAAHSLVGLLERVAPRSGLLPRLYWGMYGLYIFRGIREGIKAFGAPAIAPRGDSLRGHTSL